LKEKLYYIITEKHLAIGYKGTRNTYAEVSDKYYGVKRCLVNKFVKKYKHICKQERIVNLNGSHMLEIISYDFLGPVSLQTNVRKFTADIINNLTKLWPNLKIIYRKPRRPQTQGSVERANYILKDKLGRSLIENEDLCYLKNIPDNIQIEDDVQFDNNENSIQTKYYDDEFNENLIQNLSQSKNNDKDSMFFIMASI
ncbi:2221_t:CDS:2, partial [Gigaspora margarita]